MGEHHSTNFQFQPSHFSSTKHFLLSSCFFNKTKMNFLNKTIWITGASSGIGRAVAIETSKENAHLILSGRNEKALQEVAEICIKNGSSAEVAAFDLGDETSIESASGKVLSKHKKIDCLYHFGGISQRSFASETPLEIDRRIFEVNYLNVKIILIIFSHD